MQRPPMGGRVDVHQAIQASHLDRSSDAPRPETRARGVGTLSVLVGHGGCPGVVGPFPRPVSMRGRQDKGVAAPSQPRVLAQAADLF